MSEMKVSDSIAEVYLQISPNILESFPKFRPPVDLYRFDDSVAQVKKIHKAESRLGTAKQEQVTEDAGQGRLFLLREDYRVYAQHLSKKLGLVLVEDDLRPTEVAEIFFLAFRDRMELFLDQPTEVPLKKLLTDISILTEYLWTDPARVEFLTKTLYKEYSLAVHSVNTMFIGLAIYTMATKGKMDKEHLVSLALALILHDIGMANVPRFIVDKEQYLVRADRDSIEKHIEAGAQKLKRLGVTNSLVMQCLYQHHERIDGSGYPERRMGENIEFVGRLCGVADSFSAMVSDRPYHDPKVLTEAALALTKEPQKYEPVLAKLLAILLIDSGKLREVVSKGR